MTTATAEVVRPRTLALPRVRVAVLAPAAMYLAGQAVTMAMVAWIGHARHLSPYKLLAGWDGHWFLQIAEHGYRHSVEPGVNSVAFFPGYPLALRALHAVIHVGVEPLGIALPVAAGIAAAYGLMRLVDNRRVGLVLVGLFATAPMSVVLAMTYSEALFCALAVWALVCLRERRWLTAAVLIGLAGLTRQTGVALLAALAVAVFITGIRARLTWRMPAALLIAPIGLVGYLAWVTGVTGVHGGWFTAERKGWHTHFDWGHQTLTWSYRAVMYAPAILDVATVALLAAAVALTVRLCWQRRWELAAYAGVVVAADVMTAGVMQSKVRLLIPAFVLLIPVAEWIARQRYAWWLLAAFALAGAWYSSYALISYGVNVWGYPAVV